VTIAVPAWLLWTVGIVAGIAVLFFAVIGIVLMWSFGRGGFWR
jgi:hypothetical protein